MSTSTWAQYQIEQAQAQATAGNIPNNAWGDWATFQTDLNTAFADPNKAQNALNQPFQWITPSQTAHPT
jgi:hypothetical protein